MNYINNFSEIMLAKRMDAEYFQPKYQATTNKLKKIGLKPLAELCEFTQSGPSGALLGSKGYRKSGVKVYRPTNLNGWDCDNGRFVYTSNYFCFNQGVKLYTAGDVLISRTGDLKFGIIRESKQAVISSNLVAVRTKKNLLDPYFLLAFLNTKFGKDQIERARKQVSLASVTKTNISNMLIPRIPSQKQGMIGKLVKSGLLKVRRAKALYSKAESMLWKEVKCKESEKRDKYFRINFKLAQEAERIDAEYFQNQKIANYINTLRLGDICGVLRGIEPGRKMYADSGKLFLRVGNVIKYGLLAKSQKYLSDALFEKLAIKFQPRIGEILMVKDGKPGVACVVNKPIPGIISDGIVRLSITDNKIPAEYIALCINSVFCKQQVFADTEGSLVPHLKVEKIKRLRIPVVTGKAQREIAGIIRESFLFFQKADESFSEAKRMVSELIGANSGRNSNS